MSDKNPLGGGNPLSLYTPITETEQEVIQRLVENDELYIHVIGWGNTRRFSRVAWGDAVLKIEFFMQFDKPEIPVEVNYLDLQLKMRSIPKMVLFQKRYAFFQPLLIGAGLEIGLEWIIQLLKMSEKSVKTIKKAAKGLTTREGNRHLTGRPANLLNLVRAQEARVRQYDQQRVVEATTKTVEQVQQGIITLTGDSDS